MKFGYTFLITMVLAVVCTTASADIVFTDLGTAAPPSSLGSWAMTAFPDDPRPNGPVTSVASPLGGTVDFDISMTHVEIGSGWATWSHGYGGDVYWDDITQVTLTLPTDTAAFYLYAEPNDFGTWQIEALADDGTTSGPIDVVGASGANGFGFHSTMGTTITSIVVTADVGARGFAIGEFGIAATVIPTPSAALLGLLGLGLVACIRKFRLA